MRLKESLMRERKTEHKNEIKKLKKQKQKLTNKNPNLLPKHKNSQTYKTLYVYLGAVPTDVSVILPNKN